MNSPGSYLGFIFLFLNLALVASDELTENGIIKKMTAICGKDGIKVTVRFNQPFKGIIYSDGKLPTICITKLTKLKGHYDNPECVFVDMEKNSSKMLPQETRFSFLIPADECGTKFHDPGSSLSSNSDDEGNVQSANNLANEVYMENTVMFQKNHFIQEQGDMAQILRCVWQKEIRRPLHATLPLTIRGKDRPQHRNESVKESKKEKTQPLQTFTKPSIPKDFQYLTASQQRHIDIRKRFQGKGQVQMVPNGNSGRSAKAISFDEPVFETYVEEYKPRQDLVIHQNNPTNYSALPFKADDTNTAVSVTNGGHIYNIVICIIGLRFALNLM